MTTEQHRAGLATARKAAGLTQEDLAEALHVERSTIVRWEAGRHAPQAYLWPKLAKVLGISRDALAALLASADADVAEVTRTRVADEVSWSTSGASARAAAVVRWSGKQRDPSLVDGGLQTASHSVVFKWLLARRDEDVDNLPACDSSPQVTGDDVAALLAMKRSLTALDAEHGGGAALPLVLKYLSSEVVPLLHGRYDERIGRELFGAVAGLAMLAGWVAYDAGQHGQARKHMLHALRLSQVADDRLFGGRVLVAMSHQALHIGQIQDGIDFAAAAMKGASAVGLPAAVALFAASAARALAVSGDKQASLNLMRTAEQALDKVTVADGPEWLTFMDEAELAGKLGRCFRDLGLHREAESYLEMSLSLHKAQYPRSRAITKIIHATNYARQGELEPACQLGLEALPEVGRLRSQRTKEYLTDLYRGLDHYQGEPLVKSFREQARHLLVSGRT
jgi:DNA-binding XRE family transcriptional regulator